MKKNNLKINKKLKRRFLAVSALLAVTVAGTLGQMQDTTLGKTPEDPIPIVEVVDMQSPTDDIVIDDTSEPEDDERQLSFFARVRKRWAALPSPVRMLITAPVYILGWLIKTTLLALLKLIITNPITQTVLAVLLGALVTVLVVLCAMKAAHPDMKLKDVISKSELLASFLISAALCGAIAVAAKYYGDMDSLNDIAQVFTPFAVAAVFVFGKLMIERIRSDAK